DVVGGQGLHAGVDLVGPGLVTAEADDRELGLDHAGGDPGDPAGRPVQPQPQDLADGPDGVLGGGVAGAARVDLEAGDGAQVDDVGVGGGPQQRTEGAGGRDAATH